MFADTQTLPRATRVDDPDWSAAEILDTTMSDDIKLRALVCRLGARQWQWSVTSLDGERGELISAGIEKSAAAARVMATAEIEKCLGDAFE